MGRAWPELSKAKSHHQILLPQMEIDTSIHQNNNLNMKKEIIFRVKTFFNSLISSVLKKRCQTRKEKCDVICHHRGETPLPSCKRCWLRLTAVDNCTWLGLHLSATLLTFFIRYMCLLLIRFNLYYK